MHFNSYKRIFFLINLIRMTEHKFIVLKFVVQNAVQGFLLYLLTLLQKLKYSDLEKKYDLCFEFSKLFIIYYKKKII